MRRRRPFGQLIWMVPVPPLGPDLVVRTSRALEPFKDICSRVNRLRRPAEVFIEGRRVLQILPAKRGKAFLTMRVDGDDRLVPADSLTLFQLRNQRAGRTRDKAVQRQEYWILRTGSIRDGLAAWRNEVTRGRGRGPCKPSSTR